MSWTTRRGLGLARSSVLFFRNVARKRLSPLQITAQDLGPPGKDNRFGAGKVQVRDAALRLFHLVQAKDLAPGIGESLALHVSGFPGDGFRTRISFGQSRRKVRQMLFPELLATGVLDANGEAEVKLDIPDEPTLIGIPLVFVSTEDNRAGVTGQLLVFETVFGLAYAFLLESKLPPTLAWAGMALLFAGVALGIRAAKKPPAH